MITILRRAAAGLNLAPAQRASLKAIKAIVYLGLSELFSGQGVAAVHAALQPGANVGAIVHDQLLMPLVLVVLLTLDKYLSAQKDAPLPESSQTVAQSGQQAAVSPAEAIASTVPAVPADAQPIGTAGGASA